MPDPLDLHALEALAKAARPHRLDRWDASRNGIRATFVANDRADDARDTMGIGYFHAAVSPEVVLRLIELVRAATGMLYGKASAEAYLSGFGITDTAQEEK